MDLLEDVSIFEAVMFPLLAGVAGFTLSGIPGLAVAVGFTVSVGAVLKKLAANERRIAQLEAQLETLDSGSH